MDELIALDNKRKATQTELDANLSKAKSYAKSIGELYKSGKVDEANELKSTVAELKSKTGPLEDEMRQITQEIRNHLFKIPNMPHEKVPVGLSEDDNVVVKDWTNPLPSLIEGAKPHWELAELYNIIDFKLRCKNHWVRISIIPWKRCHLPKSIDQLFP